MTEDQHATLNHHQSKSERMTSQNSNRGKEISGQTLSGVGGTVVGIVGGTFAGVLMVSGGLALGGHLVGLAVCAGTAGLSGAAIHDMMSKNMIFTKLIVICVGVVILTILPIYFFSMPQPPYSQIFTGHYSLEYTQQYANQVSWMKTDAESLEDILGSLKASSKKGQSIPMIVNETFIKVEINTFKKTSKVVGTFPERFVPAGLDTQRQWYLYDESTPLTLQ